MNTYFSEIGLWPRSSKNVGLRYTLGFGLSLLFTISAYLLVTHRLFSQPLLLASVILLAVVQVLVQLTYFLHLGGELSARTRLITLTLAVLIVAILVIGSLWIMHNLNQRMMPSADQMQQYMNNEDAF